MKKILVFSQDLITKPVVSGGDEDIRIEKWAPSLLNMIPPSSGARFILFWLAHMMRIFQNRSYCSYKIVEENLTVSSLVCVPSLFIWSFMKKKDLQIKNVYTHPDFRGRGLAYKLIELVKEECYEEKRTIWYMTHDKNFASLKLSKKTGFEFQGYYKKRKRFLLFFRTGGLFND